MSFVGNSGMVYPRIKTNRAKDHINELTRQLRDFLGKQPSSRSEYDDLKQSLHVFRLHCDPMPETIGALVGDFVTNLRVGLDQLVWQLSLLNNPDPSRDTAFPIHSDRSERSEERFRRSVWDVPCAAVEIIKSLRPYTRGNAFKDHPLWQLNALCNIDKHRVIPYSHTEFNIKLSKVTMYKHIFVDDDILVGIPLSEKGNVQLDPGTPEAVFGEPISTAKEGSFTITLQGFGDIYNFVFNDVLPRFESFFA
jgi:hypothetical protein